MFKKFFMLTILVCMISVLSGCQEEKYELNAWKTLALTAVTYDQTMTTLGELHTKGTVSDEVANKAVDFGKKFTPLYLAAVESLEVFVKNPDETKLDTVKNAIEAASASLDLLVEFASQLGINEKESAEKVVTDENAKQVAIDATDKMKE